jgi:hypothetical protein
MTTNPHVDHARAFMCMLREFRQPNPEDHYEGMLECDVRDLAQGAALLIEATAKSLPQWLFLGEEDPELLKVRISNLEAQNDGLRVNNQALRDELARLENPVQNVTNNITAKGEPKTPRIPPEPVEIG